MVYQLTEKEKTQLHQMIVVSALGGCAGKDSSGPHMKAEHFVIRAVAIADAAIEELSRRSMI
jgi:hypothetical protein